MREPEERADELIDAFGLTHKRDTRAPRLSGGQRRRLLLARALMHRPRLVILDEPTAGVDFELRQELWRYIRRLHAEGTTILLTTHYLEEAEELCDEIGADPRRPPDRARQRPGAARALRRRAAPGRVREGDGARATPPASGSASARRCASRSCGRRRCSRRSSPRCCSSSCSGCRSAGGSSRSATWTTTCSSCPGLITMAMAQAAYANNASTIFQARFDRYVNDVLSAPMQPWQMTLGYTVGGLVRALAIGVLAAACSALVLVRRARPRIRSSWSWRSALGLTLFASLGLVVGHLRRDVGPHHVHPEHRDPAADVRRRRLLLGRRPALALGGAVALQPDLLPRERGALRLPRRERRVDLALARRGRGAGHPRLRVVPVAVQHRQRA